MDHHGLIKRVNPEYTDAIKNMPLTHHLLKLSLESGEEVVAAFRLIDMESLSHAITKIHERRGIKKTIEMQRALKPLTLEIRRNLGLTSQMEWAVLEKIGKKAESEIGQEYPLYILGVSYIWEVRPATTAFPYGVVIPQFDLNSEVGVIDTGKTVLWQ